MLSNDTKSIPALFGTLIEQFGHLLETEVRLAKAELSEKVDEATTGMAFILASGILIIPAVVMLLLAFAFWLSQKGLAPALSCLITAVVTAVLGTILLFSGLSRLKLKRLELKKTMEQVNQDLAAARNLAR